MTEKNCTYTNQQSLYGGKIVVVTTVARKELSNAYCVVKNATSFTYSHNSSDIVVH